MCPTTMTILQKQEMILNKIGDKALKQPSKKYSLDQNGLKACKDTFISGQIAIKLMATLITLCKISIST